MRKKSCWDCDCGAISSDEDFYCLLSGNVDVSNNTICDTYTDELFDDKEVVNFRKTDEDSEVK